jgi:acetolactate synthase small subunit
MLPGDIYDLQKLMSKHGLFVFDLFGALPYEIQMLVCLKIQDYNTIYRMTRVNTPDSIHTDLQTLGNRYKN